MDKLNENAENTVKKLQDRIKSVFSIFDHDGNDTIDVLEFGTVLRGLGCAPSEAEINQLISELEEEQSLRIIKLSSLLPKMTQILSEKKYRPATEMKLMKAFSTLDTENVGYLTQEQMTKYMTEEGEPFQNDELEEMFTAALDPEKGHIIYENFVNQISAENESDDEL